MYILYSFERYQLLTQYEHQRLQLQRPAVTNLGSITNTACSMDLPKLDAVIRKVELKKSVQTRGRALKGKGCH